MKELGIFHCPRGHCFEDFLSVADPWCPTCDAPWSKIYEEVAIDNAEDRE